MPNIFAQLPTDLSEEVFEDIVRSNEFRIERIVSHGQSSPAHGWYDQEQSEWVIVLKGAAELQFDDGRAVRLAVGDYINIPAHSRHKVSWTSADEPTVWLAVFYR